MEKEEERKHETHGSTVANENVVTGHEGGELGKE